MTAGELGVGILVWMLGCSIAAVLWRFVIATWLRRRSARRAVPRGCADLTSLGYMYKTLYANRPTSAPVDFASLKKAPVDAPLVYEIQAITPLQPDPADSCDEYTFRSDPARSIAILESPPGSDEPARAWRGDAEIPVAEAWDIVEEGTSVP